MCGIAGIALTDIDGKPDVETLSRMCAAITHRGPDSSGGLIESGIGLAMRRLSVVDVVGGAQPIFNEDHSVVVVFNGEIYNHDELRDSLISNGHSFCTDSDTETIVHAYEQYGLDFVRNLHGMFAIAIWDFRKQQLILARDRLGVKPLYFYHDSQRIVFGSEIKAILQHEAVPRQINFSAIHQLLTYGHMLPPETPFAEIRELAPATTMVFKAGELKTNRYWDLEFSQPNHYDERRTTESVLAEIKAAVERRLVREVPFGAFLSGGIDSGIVVALMSQLLPTPVKTFSIGFDDKDFSELPYAKMVAKHCGTEHHEMVVKPNVPDIMDELIRHHDAPFYDTSAIPMYYLSKFAREHVTVALSGDGGDEMFAGYNIYLANQVASRLNFLPDAIGRYVFEPLANLIPESSKYLNKGRIAREFAKGAFRSPLARYTRWATKVKRETRDRLYKEVALIDAQQMPDESILEPFFAKQESASELGRLLYLGTMTELPGDMLRKVDRMSMAHSLEVRSPLLDHAVFELAATLHDDAKLNGRTSKYTLRSIAKQLLPREVIDRPKRGFSIPLDRWLRTDLKPYVQSILFDAQTETRGIFDVDFVRQLAAEHFNGTIGRGREIWTLCTIELWQRAYLDRFEYSISEAEKLPLVSPLTHGA